MEQKTKRRRYDAAARLRVEGWGWLCAGWQSSCVPVAPTHGGRGHSCASGVCGSGVGVFSPQGALQ